MRALVLGLPWLLAAQEAVVARTLQALPEALRVGPAAVQALTRAWREAGPAAEHDPGWRLALAAAHVAAEDAASATALLTPLPTEPAQRTRALALWLECWRLRAAAGTPEPAEPLPWLRAAGADAPLLVSAALAQAEALGRGRALAAAVQALDAALPLAAELPAWRVLVLQRRVLLMEAAGESPQAITAWLAARQDPAAAQVVVGTPSGAAALLGQPAPATAFPALLGEGTVQVRAGQPTLIYVHAFWAPSCRAADAVLRSVVADFPQVAVIAVSLHQPQQAQQARAHALTLPGQQAGDTALWQAPWLADWGVEAVPHLALVSADGRVLAGDLCVGDPAGLEARLRTALAALPASEEVHRAP